MPLVAHSNLPSFKRLSRAGQEVLSPEEAATRGMRELHIGFLNMMPDAALQATERQFLRLIGACNRIGQFHVHPFTIAGVDREGAAKHHVETHYENFSELASDGLDALIITGANVTEADITNEEFFEPMTAVMDWATNNVCSTFCSCLSSHGAFKHFHDIDRTHLTQKRWGVYSHRVAPTAHPLFAGTNTRFDVPHSRFNDVPQSTMEDAGLRVLAASDEAGVLAAASPDGWRYIYFQGHPEYDTTSLLKEYKREVYRFLNAEREDYPPFPEHYFPSEAKSTFNSFRDEVSISRKRSAPPSEFPEDHVTPLVDNTWADTAKAIFNNWLGLVYQLTADDRKTPFIPGVDPDDPLGLK